MGERRLLSLQMGRGLAANAVVIAHLSLVQNWFFKCHALPDLTYIGWAGVDFFFVLSGFIMSAVAGRNVSPLRFLWQRAARIYPLYWIATSLIIILWLCHSLRINGPISYWHSFLLIPDVNPPLITVGWTLVFEIYFYLVFSLILATRLPLGVGLAAWIGLYAILMGVPGRSPIWQTITSPLNLEFMAGAAIGILWQQGRMPLPRGAFIGAGVLAAAGLYAGWYFEITNSLELGLGARVTFFGIPAAAILYCLCASEQRQGIKPPAILVKLGDWSYATYISHLLIIFQVGKCIGWVSNGIFADAVFFVAGLIVANALGWALHTFIERPLLPKLYGLWPLKVSHARAALGQEARGL